MAVAAVSAMMQERLLRRGNDANVKGNSPSIGPVRNDVLRKKYTGVPCVTVFSRWLLPCSSLKGFNSDYGKLEF